MSLPEAPCGFGGILMPMSRRQVLVLLLWVGVVLQPLAGLDCSPRGQKRLPCCDEPAAGCHRVGAAVSCCPEVPASTDSSTVVAARPTSRPHDVLGMVVAHEAVAPLPLFAAGLGAFKHSAVEPPPRPPAVLRL
jgi:hypothetical protein